jgi:hypothetical protein
LVLQRAPGGAQTQTPPEQLCEQQSLAASQVVPAAPHAHFCCVQLPEQQPAPSMQLVPGGAHAHVPSTQRPEQQKASWSHTAPVSTAHTQAPATHAPEVQSLATLHSPPGAAGTQAPPMQTPEQQSLSAWHVEVTGRQAHAPLSQVAVQQPFADVHAAPTAAHTQWPCVHVPRQHWESLAQPFPGLPHVQREFASVAPEQQVTVCPDVPATRQQVPSPHTWVGVETEGSQSPSPLHGLPSAPRQLPASSTAAPQQSLVLVSLPEGVPGAAQPHAPSTQRPEQQPWSSVHGASRGAHTHFPSSPQPPKQQSESFPHTTPYGLHVQWPARSPPPEQQEAVEGGAAPGGAHVQVPSRHRPELHCTFFSHPPPLPDATRHQAPSQKNDAPCPHTEGSAAHGGRLAHEHGTGLVQ